MTRYAMLCAALLLAAPAAAQNQPVATPVAGQPTPPFIDSRSDPADFDLARKKVTDCEGEKFVFAWGAGASPTKVTLCSKKDATPDELVTMLDDAASKLEQTTDIAEDRRLAIIEQIRAKISELKGSSAAAADLAKESIAASARLPAEPAKPVVSPVAPEARAAAAKPVPATKPRLSFECSTPGDLGSRGPCTILRRNTQLTVKAGEPLAGATILRFIRNGQSRGELPIRKLGKGQSVRLALPPGVCAGVFTGRAEIQIVRGGQIVDSLGPYTLRC